MKTLFFLALATTAIYAKDLSMLPSLEQQATVVIQVGDREDAGIKLVKHAESIGGWFLAWNEWSVTLRIPTDSLSQFLKNLDSLGRKVEQTYSTSDQSIALVNLEASIASRRKLLESYFSMVRSTEFSKAQVIEQAIVSLISQIELDEGKLRAMQSRIKDAWVQVSFRFEDRSLPPADGQSAFPWINQLNLVDHREKFQ